MSEPGSFSCFVFAGYLVDCSSSLFFFIFGHVSKLLSVLGKNGKSKKEPVPPPYGPVLQVSKNGHFGTIILKRAHMSGTI